MAISGVKGSKTVLGSAHMIEHLLFSMFPSILFFHFYFIFECRLGHSENKKIKILMTLSFISMVVYVTWKMIPILAVSMMVLLGWFSFEILQRASNWQKNGEKLKMAISWLF